MTSLLPFQEPQKKAGTRVPLFDRLADFDIFESREVPVQKFLTLEELHQSIERELWHIIGTQAKFKREEYTELAKDSLNFALPGMYGVPEFTAFEATDAGNWPQLSRLFEKVITYYEPRLAHVRVIIQRFNGQTQNLEISILAELAAFEFQEEVTFALKLQLL